MRAGELCALKWESVDLARQEITVERHIIRGLETPGGKTGNTKLSRNIGANDF